MPRRCIGSRWGALLLAGLASAAPASAQEEDGRGRAFAEFEIEEGPVFVGQEFRVGMSVFWDQEWFENHGVPLFLPETLEAGFVLRERFVSDGGVERRGTIVGDVRLQRGRWRPAGRAAQRVADAIDHRLSQIRLKRTLAPRLERVEVLQCLDHRVLDEVRGVDTVPRPARQTPRRRAAKGRDVRAEQTVERLLVSSARAEQQINGIVGGVCARREVQ